MSTILLTGATGNVTSAVIRSLQGSGHRLIGLIRDPAKAKDLAAQGVELRTGDLSLLRTAEGAFEGVDVAWLLTPPGPSAPIQASNALWAARLGGVKHVVRMSAVGAATMRRTSTAVCTPSRTRRSPDAASRSPS
ncbi:MAG TPA: NAD(P)H-binding protein [Chthoniobacterales bacterium]|nr:NAD(P)H-binding protein [Chthoniobacterales bacterium]